MQFIRFPKTLDYDWITISDEMLESTLTVFRTTFRANIKYDRRQNERTIIHQLFLRNPSLLHRDSYADHKYELSLKEKQDNCRQNCDFILMPDLPSHRSEEHTSELQSLMRISYAVFCLKKKNNNKHTNITTLTK